jgi:uncharacterized protein
MSARLHRIFGRAKPIIGVVHLAPLPGAPGSPVPVEFTIEKACTDATVLAGGGLDGIIVENYGDAPFLPGPVKPETVAGLTLAVHEIRRAVDIPIGVNVLRNDAAAALGIAVAAGGRFIRVNVHTGATVTDQGLIQGEAHATLRDRDRLGADDIAILADVHVKHGHPLGGGSILEAARDAVERGRADAVLVTGSRTGAAADLAEVRQVVDAVPGTPVLVASGVTQETISETLDVAGGVIVCSSLEVPGADGPAIHPARVEALMVAAGRG